MHPSNPAPAVRQDATSILDDCNPYWSDQPGVFNLPLDGLDGMLDELPAAEWLRLQPSHDIPTSWLGNGAPNLRYRAGEDLAANYNMDLSPSDTPKETLSKAAAALGIDPAHTKQLRLAWRRDGKVTNLLKGRLATMTLEGLGEKLGIEADSVLELQACSTQGCRANSLVTVHAGRNHSPDTGGLCLEWSRAKCEACLTYRKRHAAFNLAHPAGDSAPGKIRTCMRAEHCSRCRTVEQEIAEDGVEMPCPAPGCERVAMSHEGSRFCGPCRGPPAPMPDADGSDGYVGKRELSLLADPVGLPAAESEDSTPDSKRRRLCPTLVRAGPLRIGVIAEAPPTPVTAVLDAYKNMRDPVASEALGEGIAELLGSNILRILEVSDSEEGLP
jgi:hypothetical protein